MLINVYQQIRAIRSFIFLYLLFSLKKIGFFSQTPRKGSVDVKRLPNKLKCRKKQ